MCAFYSEYGDRTDDVAVVLETLGFFFRSDKENSCHDAHFVCDFGLLGATYAIYSVLLLPLLSTRCWGALITRPIRPMMRLHVEEMIA